MADEPHRLGAAEAARLIRGRKLTSRELVEDCLNQIARHDADIEAWAFLDPDHALRQAEACDADLARGGLTGPLHGVPVGIKDIYDTDDMPTENGSPLHAGRRPERDSAAVALLRAAGAVILGKTVTTEFANMHPGKTRNPHDPARTPGGSSSGSAAAVAAHMVPAAVGSQTNGSVIRPAAFCGVVGFKPTHGLIPRTGILQLSRALDTMGSFTRSVEDAALVVECMAGFDAGDPDTRPQARPPLVETARQEPATAPRLAFVRTPVWDKAEASTRAAFEDLARRLGIETVELPQDFAHVHEWQRIICDVEMATGLAVEYDRGRERMSAGLVKTIERGQTALAVDYKRALAGSPALNALLAPTFARFDALLTPATPGVAPVGLETTGNPVFNTIWTYLGTPAVTLPLLKGDAGMPLGLQLVGPRNADAQLLRTANWLVARLR